MVVYDTIKLNCLQSTQSADASSSPSSHQHKDADQEEEIRDLHLRVKMMAEADQKKNSRVEQLEKEVHNYRSLVAKVEQELGSERLAELRDNKNGAAKQPTSRQPVKTNEIAPPQESQVCTIL